MTIIRNGEQITLNPSEIVKAWEEHERSIIRYEVETILEDYSFGNYSEQGSEYESEEDFKEDFIEMCVDSCFDRITEDEVSAFNDKVGDIVSSLADDFNLENDF